MGARESVCEMCESGSPTKGREDLPAAPSRGFAGDGQITTGMLTVLARGEFAGRGIQAAPISHDSLFDDGGRPWRRFTGPVRSAARSPRPAIGRAVTLRAHRTTLSSTPPGPPTTR